ncbi:MAG: ATP-dependent DNA ligase [Planctomycetota bacterium]
MKRFAAVFEALDRTTSTSAKVAAIRAYVESSPACDAAWGIWFLAGNKLKRTVPSKVLRQWCRERAGVSRWLFAECYSTVGDLAETVALLIDAAPADGARVVPSGGQMLLADLAPSFDADGSSTGDGGLAWWVEHRLASLRGLDSVRQRGLLDTWCEGLSATELLLLCKMLTGAMRIGVSRTLVERALSEAAGVEQAVVAHRLSGGWSPAGGGRDGRADAALTALLSGEAGDGDRSRPYPFFLASPVAPPVLPADVSSELELVERELGSASGWLAEWKWDGIRAQLIRRGGETFLWSRGDEALTHRFPEVVEVAAQLEDGVLDGELLCWDEARDRPMDFGVLQRRIGREALTPGVLRSSPAVFLAYDLLEIEGKDLREGPIESRLGSLDRLIEPGMGGIRVGERFGLEGWEQAATLRGESRERCVEGLMLKRRGSPYRSGRRRGDWWKWKVDPLTLDAVLTYAQPGHGRRAGLLTDYTFGVWDPDDAAGSLVTVAKAYSGLTDEEFVALDRWLRAHTVERFGPVRRVEPVHVFELAFDSIRPSDRHASGVALRFPRMRRWRKDKPASEADTLAGVRAMLGPSPGEAH